MLLNLNSAHLVKNFKIQLIVYSLSKNKFQQIHIRSTHYHLKLCLFKNYQSHHRKKRY